MQQNRSRFGRVLDSVGSFFRIRVGESMRNLSNTILREKPKGKVSLGFYYALFKSLFSTDLAKRLEKAEYFTLSSRRNFYNKDRVMKIPHFLAEFKDEEVVKTNRDTLTINVRGRPYTLEPIAINDEQSVSGKRLYEIKGLTDGLITTRRKELSAYCIWVDADNKISDPPYNTPGNLKMLFHGSVKAFSPVVRGKRDRSINIVATLIAFPVHVGTLVTKGAVYAAIELLKVAVRLTTHVVIPVLFIVISSIALTVGLFTMPFLSKQGRKDYLSHYPTVLKTAGEMFCLGTLGYVKKNLLDSENIYYKLESIKNGALEVSDDELKILNSKKTALSVLNKISIVLEFPIVVLRGVTNFSCSLLRAVASSAIGVLTLNPDYFKASKFLVKQPFQEIKDDVSATLNGKGVSSPTKMEQVIGFDETAFNEAIKKMDETSSSMDLDGVALLGMSLRSTGFSEAGEDSGTPPFVPRSCITAMRGQAI
ncbi:hypothetical protein NHE_0007 [Neorickettsia helminthoeca str. Oregon]|uniref:Uncharacterized protein n=1 Tax=Neorickettsia helminthoeca str. Oregon TaxID=1286528 RepID=X5HIU9_9RICK|nr:hypothetical protein [Neorickettsia helminthoeca]AHX10984.1 hypothetical protein NHE_0007 [Neorickettsia helminthoeca str. Oregon]